MYWLEIEDIKNLSNEEIKDIYEFSERMLKVAESAPIPGLEENNRIFTHAMELIRDEFDKRRVWYEDVHVYDASYANTDYIKNQMAESYFTKPPKIEDLSPPIQIETNTDVSFSIIKFILFLFGLVGVVGLGLSFVMTGTLEAIIGMYLGDSIIEIVNNRKFFDTFKKSKDIKEKYKKDADIVSINKKRKKFIFLEVGYTVIFLIIAITPLKDSAGADFLGFLTPIIAGGTVVPYLISSAKTRKEIISKLAGVKLKSGKNTPVISTKLEEVKDKAKELVSSAEVKLQEVKKQEVKKQKVRTKVEEPKRETKVINKKGTTALVTKTRSIKDYKKEQSKVQTNSDEISEHVTNVKIAKRLLSLAVAGTLGVTVGSIGFVHTGRYLDLGETATINSLIVEEKFAEIASDVHNFIVRDYPETPQYYVNEWRKVNDKSFVDKYGVLNYTYENNYYLSGINSISYSEANDILAGDYYIPSGYITVERNGHIEEYRYAEGMRQFFDEILDNRPNSQRDIEYYENLYADKGGIVIDDNTYAQYLRQDLIEERCEIFVVRGRTYHVIIPKKGKSLSK